MTTVIDLTAELAKLKMLQGRTPQTTSADRAGTSAQLAPYRDGALFTSKFTGLGAWAAGSASLMPALADAVPDYIDCVSILAHPDPAGIKGANELATRLRIRGTGCVVLFLGMETAA